MYTVRMIDKSTFVVGDKTELCTCTSFEGEEFSAEERANKICAKMNEYLFGYVVLDVSKDYGEGTFGVNLNDLSDNDFQGINCWEEKKDAFDELGELEMRDVAGAWQVFGLVEAKEDFEDEIPL